MFTRPALVLRLEDACLLLAAILLYHHLRFSWPLFAVLFLVPDLSMLGYLLNAKLGSALYNFGHALFLPVLLFIFAFSTERPLCMSIGIVWFAHIVFDRLLGYGLKYPTHFKDTHLQHVA